MPEMTEYQQQLLVEQVAAAEQQNKILTALLAEIHAARKDAECADRRDNLLRQEANRALRVADRLSAEVLGDADDE